MPVQIPTKKDWMPVHTVFQFVPNQPKNTLASPLSMFNTVPNAEEIPFQMLPKTSFTPCHARLQLPVKMPANISNKPVNVFSTVLKMLLISAKAPSKIGARKLQKPSQMAFMTSVILWKLNPRAFNLSTIPWQNPCTAETIPFQIFVIATRNASFVSHRCLKAATNTAITPTMIRTGADIEAIDAFSAFSAGPVA